MAGKQEITVKSVDWSETVRDHLCAVKNWPDHESPDGYREALKSGDICALGVFAENDQIGTTFYKIDRGDQGSELVILASFGRLKSVDLTALILPVMEQIARDAGCFSVAFVTARVGLIKKTARCGYSISETIMRKGHLM